MTRSVLIVGFPGIQALDLVGPFEVTRTTSPTWRSARR
jgi:hypothetical protein